MALAWVLFNLTGTLVDPTVLAQPLGDSGADEELVLNAIDDTIAIAMVDALTGASTPFNEMMEAAMRRRLRLAGTDEELAVSALELVSTMPAYLEAPGALESLRARGLKLGVLAQTSAEAADAVLRFAGLRDRLELVLSAQDSGAYKPDPRPYRMALEQTGVERRARCASSRPTGGTSREPSGRACARRGSRAASARCSTPFRRPTTPAATSPRWPRRSSRASPPDVALLTCRRAKAPGNMPPTTRIPSGRS